MPLVKVIVQGIPINVPDLRHSVHLRAECPDPENCADRDKLFLEQLFTKYGPSKCAYIFSNDIDSPLLGRFSYDNFAHMIFQNVFDAFKACEAAADHEIEINNHILTLTVVSNDTVLIGQLDDNCLLEVFSRLDLESKLVIESVCKRWKGLALKSWSTVKILNLENLPYDVQKFEKYLMRCGTYLDRITFNVKSPEILHLIRTYCKALKTVVLDSMPSEQIYFDEVSELLKVLTELKSFTLVEDSVQLDVLSFLLRPTGEDKSRQLKVLKNLPGSLEEISLSFMDCFARRLQSLDLSKCRKLRCLKLSMYDIDEGDLKGIENWENLEYLEFERCFGCNNYIEKIQNFTKLKTLKIGYFGGPVDNNVILTIVMNNRILECLDLSGNKTLTDHSLLEISMLPRLKALDISSCSQISLNLIDEMPLLEKLDCEYCPKVINETVDRLIQLAPNLKYLNVKSCSITAELPEIANCAIKTRESDVVLEIKANVSSVPENLSPLLVFDCLGELQAGPQWPDYYADVFDFMLQSSDDDDADENED